MPTFLPPDFDAYVNQVLQQWGISGAAIAIVKDDEVVFAKGYGVRDVTNNDPIDEQTVFGIGSATKAFTAATAAILVDEGKLGWDTPIIEYLPDFQLSDPWVTAQISLRDLLSHRSGLPRGIVMRLRSGGDLESYLARYRYAKFEKSFRSRYLYSNTNFDWAGKVVEAVSGEHWGEFMSKRIFAPLGMAFSSTNLTALERVENLAAPHALLKGALQTVPRLDIGDDPAGSINANALDMAEWLRMLLNNGNSAGAQVLSPTAIYEMHAPQTAVPHPEETELAIFKMLNPPINFWTYGFGWWVQDYHHAKLVWHGGQIDGFSSMVAMLPDKNFGFVVLTNIHETFGHGVLMLTLLDAYLKKSDRDWNAVSLDVAQKYGAQQAERAKKVQSARIEGTLPTLPLSEYAGIFSDPWQGEVEVFVQDKKLSLRYEKTTAPLSHWQDDTFRLTWSNPLYAPAFVTFSLDATRRVNQVTIDGLTTFKKT